MRADVDLAELADMTLDDLYPRLMDAMVTEYVNGFTSRHSVREQVEKMLDKMRPADEPQGWGRSMSKSQWEQLMGSRKKKQSTTDG